MEANSETSIRKMAKIKNMSPRTLRCGMVTLEMSSRVRSRRQLLTGAQKERRLVKGTKVHKWIKDRGYMKKVRVFTDEKKFYVDQPFNHRNDRCVVHKSAEVIPITRTKHP